MPTFEYEKATERLISALESHRLTIREELLLASPQQELLPSSWLTRTPLFGLVLDSFGTKTSRWYARLVDESYAPDWHVVRIDPDVSPLELDDWRMCAPSMAAALATVLEAMTDARAKPVRTERDGNSIVIHGESGQIAAIERMRFEYVGPRDRDRAVTALKGLRRSPTQAEVESGFRKLQGYERFQPRMDLATGNPQIVECLHIDAGNLCTAMRSMLASVVKEEVPRHLAQEIVAVFFGMSDWQHFAAKVKDRQAVTQRPHMLTTEDREHTDYLDVSYAHGLPEALFLFGQRLRLQERNVCTYTGGSRLRLCNFTPSDRATFMSTGEMYVERRGIVLHEVPEVYPDPDMCYLAATMLDQSDLSHAINAYLLAGLNERERMIEFNVRAGARREDHVTIGGWVYYVNRSRGEGYFSAEPVAPIPPSWESISSALHKAALIEVKGEYWLSTDWDRKPEHKLPGLDSDGALLISRKLGIMIEG